MTFSKSIAAAVMAALVVSQVFAQTGTEKGTAQTKTTPKTSTTAQTKKVAPHWVGDVKSVSDKKLTLMVGKKDFVVDASKAKVFNNKKAFALSKLSTGSRVSVYGKLKGNDITARDVYVLRVGPAKAPAKHVAPAKKPTTKKATGGSHKG